ncbi:hypothetical protein AB0O52_06345 [Arthrobacter sp. NPDC080073]
MINQGDLNYLIERRNAKLGISEEEPAADPTITLLTEIRDSPAPTVGILK